MYKNVSIEDELNYKIETGFFPLNTLLIISSYYLVMSDIYYSIKFIRLMHL